MHNVLTQARCDGQSELDAQPISVIVENSIIRLVCISKLIMIEFVLCFGCISVMILLNLPSFWRVTEKRWFYFNLIIQEFLFFFAFSVQFNQDVP